MLNSRRKFGLYFLGHMAWALFWAYAAWALIPSAIRNGKLFIPAILILGILPDSDLLLEGVGIMHRTVTHSIFFWTVLFIPVFFILRLKAVPYFVAVVQHFAFGDFIMGKVMIFWPFSSKLYGLTFGMPSIVDVTLETAGLLLALGLILHTVDLKRLFSVDKGNVLMIVPLLALLISALYFARDFSLSSFVAYIFSNNLLLVLAIGHVILFGFITFSGFQGLRALLSKRNT